MTGGVFILTCEVWRQTQTHVRIPDRQMAAIFVVGLELGGGTKTLTTRHHSLQTVTACKLGWAVGAPASIHPHVRFASPSHLTT